MLVFFFIIFYLFIVNYDAPPRWVERLSQIIYICKTCSTIDSDCLAACQSNTDKLHFHPSSFNPDYKNIKDGIYYDSETRLLR